MNVLGLELKTVYLLRVYTYRGPGGSGKDAGVTAVSRTEVCEGTSGVFRAQHPHHSRASLGPHASTRVTSGDGEEADTNFDIFSTLR